MSLYSEFGPDKSDVLERFEGFKFAEISDALKGVELPEETRRQIVRAAISKAIARVKERKENPKVEMNDVGLAKEIFTESVAPHLPALDGDLKNSIQTRISGILAGIALAVQICIEPSRPREQSFITSRRTEPMRGRARKKKSDRRTV